MNFNEKVVLITGAAVGIGRATAKKFAEYGAKLVLLDIDFVGLQSVQKELEADSKEVLIYPCDVSNEARVVEVVADALQQFGKIDVLINNAALWRDRFSFVDAPADVWKKYLDINVMGTVYVTKAVLPCMIAQSYGRIVNVASVAGVYGNAKMAHYSATKGAVISLTKALAKEVVGNGVLVNAVSPGSVSSSKEKDVDFYAPSELSYMGRTGTDRENANLICFLASEEASYITGQNIQIDGCRRKM